jgi:hypothetical protein
MVFKGKREISIPSRKSKLSRPSRNLVAFQNNAYLNISHLPISFIYAAHLSIIINLPNHIKRSVTIVNLVIMSM